MYIFIRSDAPAPVSLQSAVDSVNNASPDYSSGQPAPSPSAATALPDGGGSMLPAMSLDNPAGEWTLAPGAPSFAGYRVVQQVAGVGSETVVGRSPNLRASLTFDGAAVTRTQVTVDMTALKSDESLRDSTLRREAIETADFPTATFTLTSPIDVATIPQEGTPVMQTVSGDLTLHGVTRPVQVEVQAQLQGGRLIVVGSHEVQFSDFGITAPRGPASVLSVEDHGIFEFQLVLAKVA